MHNYERERRYEYDVNPTLNEEPFHRYSTGHHRKEPLLSSTPHRRDSRSTQYMEMKRTDQILNDCSFQDQQNHLVPNMNESYEDRTASAEYKKREKKPYQLQFNQLMQDERQRGVKKVFFGKEEDYSVATNPNDAQKKPLDRVSVQKPCHGGIVHNRGFEGDYDWRKKGNQRGDQRGDQRGPRGDQKRQSMGTAQKQNKSSGSNLKKGRERTGESREVSEREVVEKIGRISRLNAEISARLQRLLEKVS